MIKNLLFDLGGVIMNLDRNRCVKALEALGLAEADEMLGIAVQKGPFGQLESGQIGPDEFRNEIRTRIGRPVSDADIDGALNRFLLGIPVQRLHQLRQLRERYGVYMLSNTNPIMWNSFIADQFRQEGREVGDYFDLPVLVDYWLFIELLHATDNSGKNMYWAVYDCRQSGKLTPIPWDLDGTFGRNWDGSRGPCAATNNYDNYLRGEGKQNYLVERLYRLDAQNWRERVRRRYAELRRGPFSADALLQRFEHYRSQLEKSGAGERERRRWNGQSGRTPDYAGEIKYLEGWLKERLATLDRKYDF